MRALAVLLLFFPLVAYSQIHTVNNLNDTGPGSLRELINNAHSGDTIQIDPGLLSNGSDTLKLHSQIEIDSPLTIFGAIQGADTLYVTGVNANRAFNLDVDSWLGPVYLSNFVFTNFSTSSGGGVIYSNRLHSLSLKNCVFRHNLVSGNFPSGGAISIYNGDLKLEDCTFSNNGSASCSSLTGYGSGGAIEVTFGTLRAENCSFNGNSTCQSGGAVLVALGKGLFSHCTFRSNRVSTDFTLAGGGAVHLNGAANSRFAYCIFENNESERGGGALAFLSTYGRVDIESCSFNGNKAIQGNGGGIYTAGVDSLYVNNSTFTNNQYTVSGSFNNGGACYFQESYVQLKTSTLYNNEAPAIALSTLNSWHIDLINSSILNTTSSAKALVDGDPDYSFRISSSIIVGGGSGASVEDNMTVTNRGYNIIKDNPSFAVPTDQTNIPFSMLGLEPFGFYGGYGKTLMPGPTSLALNTGHPQDYTDAQNGVIFGTRDAGAAERPVVRTDTAVACQEFLWNGNVYSQSDTYTDSSYNANGLDSVNVLVLTLTSIDTAVFIQNGWILASANDSGTSYQWVDCTNGYASIPGATDSSFFPASNGDYAVVLTKGNCSDTSACLAYYEFSMEDPNYSRGWLAFYPNPTYGRIHIQTKGPGPATIAVSDLSGKTVYKRKLKGESQLQLPGLPRGTYLLRWESENGEVQTDRIVLR